MSLCYFTNQEQKANPDLCLDDLDFTKDKILLKQTQMQCCSGNGHYFMENRGVIICPLRKRLKEINDLYLKFKTVWGNVEFPRTLNQSQKARILSWFKYYQHKGLRKGIAYFSESQANKPSLLWTVALIGAWVYGISPNILTLLPIEDHKLEGKFLRDHEQNSLVLVERIRNLWESEQALRLTHIINWCELYCLPLWMEFAVDPEESNPLVKLPNDRVSTHKQKLAKAFHEKITQSKSKHPLSWLKEDSHSRLLNVSHLIRNL